MIQQWRRKNHLSSNFSLFYNMER